MPKRFSLAYFGFPKGFRSRADVQRFTSIPSAHCDSAQQSIGYYNVGSEKTAILRPQGGAIREGRLLARGFLAVLAIRYLLSFANRRDTKLPPFWPRRCPLVLRRPIKRGGLLANGDQKVLLYHVSRIEVHRAWGNLLVRSDALDLSWRAARRARRTRRSLRLKISWFFDFQDKLPRVFGDFHF